MHECTPQEIRNFRLRRHHLDRYYDRTDIEAITGGCGMQNSPPGSWEVALANRIGDCDDQWIARLLEEERTLVQAWSIRGVPLVFPVSRSTLFLSSLIAGAGEGWIYTRGASWALEQLQLEMDEALSLAGQVMVRLDGETIIGKAALDQRVAAWMEELLDARQRTIWQQRSIYDARGIQSLGEALVSFMLRPLSYQGLVVFGKRTGQSPSFTSYRNWVGSGIEEIQKPPTTLVEAFLHCYGPATPRHFSSWLGSSFEQAQRLWQEGAGAMEAVKVGAQMRYMLAQDVGDLLCARPPERSLLLLGAHDPYLGLQDREIICMDRTQQKIIWQTVANPGAIIKGGEAVGQWRGKKRGERLTVELTLWGDHHIESKRLEVLANQQAKARGCELEELLIHT